MSLTFSKYFNDKVLIKRPYIKLEWLADIKENYLRKEVQDDGRIRYWIYINEFNKYRVVFLEDNETIHNAFFDRNFKEDK
ncbi:MAG: hypothetical protein ACYCSW_11375 [bacterium]